MTRLWQHPGRTLILLGATLMISACGSMSGLDAHSTFACKAPEGILCESMSGIYANAQQQNLPGQRLQQAPAGPAAPLPGGAPDAMPAAITSGTPIRTVPRVLRIWFVPWEDSDGDLHDQSYVYLTIGRGHWRIEHQRERLADRTRPVRALAPQAPSPLPTTGAPPDAAAPASLTDESVGIRQNRPVGQMAADMLSGIVTPAGPPPVD